MPTVYPVGTAVISTGNVRTTYDPVAQATAGGSLGSPASYQLSASGLGLRNTLGTTYLDQGGPDSVSGTLTQLPLYQVALYKYVLYKSATNGALVARPGPVYYTDNTFTIVSGTLADGVTATASDFAGIMMLNTTDLSTATATLLNNAGAGSGIWICVGGFVKALNAPGSTAVGDSLVGATGNFTLARVASGTASTFVRTATALTAVSSNASDAIVNIVPVT